MGIRLMPSISSKYLCHRKSDLKTVAFLHFVRFPNGISLTQLWTTIYGNFVLFLLALALALANKIKFYDTKNVATNILDVVLLAFCVADAAAFRQKANSAWPFFKLLAGMEDNGQDTHTLSSGALLCR